MVQMALKGWQLSHRFSPAPMSVPWGRLLALVALLSVSCGASQPQANTALSYEGQLAEHLSTTGSVMYGAYWCPHCADQKAMFGDAVDQLTYVECAADGDEAQPQLCSEKGIKGYPTWEIGGQLHPGVKSLEDLATLSGFPAPQ